MVYWSYLINYLPSNVNLIEGPITVVIAQFLTYTPLTDAGLILRIVSHTTFKLSITFSVSNEHLAIEKQMLPSLSTR